MSARISVCFNLGSFLNARIADCNLYTERYCECYTELADVPVEVYDLLPKG
jgi:hypothetical protein